MCKFTIAIPAFKDKFLKECIDSVLSQTLNDFEILVLNDCSPYGIDAIVESYNDKRIRYYKNDINVGAMDVVNNWNKLLSLANGEFIICIGDDDLLFQNCLEEYHNMILKYPELDLYHGWTEIIDDKSEPWKMQEPRPEREGMFSMIWGRWNGRLQFIGDFCFRTSKLKELGGFYYLPMAWGSDDITAYRVCGEKGVANTQIPIFKYRESRYTITRSADNKPKAESIIGESNALKSLLEIAPTSIEETLYRNSVIGLFDNHYKMKIQMTIMSDFRSCGFRNFFYWFGKRREYSISNARLILSIFKGLKARHADN